MKFDDIHPTVRASYAAHQALRRLGFSADELYTAVVPPDRLVVAIVRDGKRVFTWDVAKTDVAPDDYEQMWNGFVAAVQDRNEVDDETRERMYHELQFDRVGLIRILAWLGATEEDAGYLG
jgi:hypothetical protein